MGTGHGYSTRVDPQGEGVFGRQEFGRYISLSPYLCVVSTRELYPFFIFVFFVFLEVKGWSKACLEHDLFVRPDAFAAVSRAFSMPPKPAPTGFRCLRNILGKPNDFSWFHLCHRVIYFANPARVFLKVFAIRTRKDL